MYENGGRPGLVDVLCEKGLCVEILVFLLGRQEELDGVNEDAKEVEALEQIKNSPRSDLWEGVYITQPRRGTC